MGPKPWLAVPLFGAPTAPLVPQGPGGRAPLWLGPGAGSSEPHTPSPPAGQTGKYQTYLCKGGAGSRGWGLKTGAGRPLRAPAPAGVAPPKGSLWGGTGRGEEVHPLESRAGGGEWATSCAAFQPVNYGVTLAGLTYCGGHPIRIFRLGLSGATEPRQELSWVGPPARES